MYIFCAISSAGETVKGRGDLEGIQNVFIHFLFQDFPFLFFISCACISFTALEAVAYEKIILNMEIKI